MSNTCDVFVLKVKSATLLSVEEAESFLSKKDREYSRWWWLRSPGYLQNIAAYVNYDGSVYYYGNYVYIDYLCVRPALEIDLTSSNLEVGDTFKFGNKDFKIISNDLAFCLGDIGQSCFRKDWLTPDANDYTHSDIKEYVDVWFEKAMDNNPRL